MKAIDSHINLSFSDTLKLKLKDYIILSKFRLTLLVVFTSVIGYYIAASGAVGFLPVFVLALGGFLVTASSNTFNQIYERDSDKLMKRTADRPLPAGRMQQTEAYIFAGITGVGGLILLSVFFSPLVGLLSALSLLSYAFIYTPMKKVSTIAVFIGGIPGALPPAIGYVAVTGQFDLYATLLFSIQYLWQLPHFWSIAWLAFDDYKKAGIMLLPSKKGKSKSSVMVTVFYTALLLPVGILPFYFGFAGLKGTVVLSVMGILFLAQSFDFYVSMNDKSAKNLMFTSFFYLPIALICLLADKI